MLRFFHIKDILANQSGENQSNLVKYSFLKKDTFTDVLSNRKALKNHYLCASRILSKKQLTFQPFMKKRSARQVIEPEQKALEINLNEKIYGTFSEIGAGQEVARLFFQVGAAAGTIAKTMSAYDKTYSDCIYGVEKSGRYVCESRLYKMLDHEYGLMEERLTEHRPDACFFAFADTVSAINYAKTNKGKGWMGLRFQLQPDGPPNEIVLHVKLKDNDNRLQQQAVGILGTNLVYGAFHYADDVESLVVSLMDNLRDRVQIDLIRIDGPDFSHIDNRLVSLWMVRNGLTEVAMFDADGRNIHASEFLYKKNLLIIRGSYRPITWVNMDMLKTGRDNFLKNKEVNPKKTFILPEITLDNLASDGAIDEQDFLDRAELLSALGQTVIISDCENYPKLIQYFSDYKIQHLGLVIGVRVLLSIINERYYQNKEGQLLAAFGELFSKNVKLFIYPSLQEGSAELMNCHNVPIPEGIRFLYKHLLENHQLEDIQGFNEDKLHIFSKDVLRLLRSDEPGWDKMVPPKVANLIKEKCLFNFPCQRLEFEY